MIGLRPVRAIEDLAEGKRLGMAAGGDAEQYSEQHECSSANWENHWLSRRDRK
jgi:hypothetical protein